MDLLGLRQHFPPFYLDPRNVDLLLLLQPANQRLLKFFMACPPTLGNTSKGMALMLTLSRHSHKTIRRCVRGLYILPHILTHLRALMNCKVTSMSLCLLSFISKAYSGLMLSPIQEFLSSATFPVVTNPNV